MAWSMDPSCEWLYRGMKLMNQLAENHQQRSMYDQDLHPYIRPINPAIKELWHIFSRNMLY